MVGAPDADILAADIEILRKRIATGTATFLVKVKAHRGEPANERANILADKAISDPKVGKEWCHRTNRAVFTRGGAAENLVQEEQQRIWCKNMKRGSQVLGDK